MALFLNPVSENFIELNHSGRFVDKSLLIKDLAQMMRAPDTKYVCISRPRRFGKTITANMLCNYYAAGHNSTSLFDSLKIAQNESYKTHLNQYNVIFINMTDEYERCHRHIDELKQWLFTSIGRELKQAYPRLVYTKEDDLSLILRDAHEQTNKKFVFIIDEWDCVMRQARDNEVAIKDYLEFLKVLFKDKDHVALAFMTGILPIKKYGDHSALNSFKEYSILSPGRFAPYMGFTEDEVRALCDSHSLSFGEMRLWYDGYTVGKAGHIFNPNSVVNALDEGEFDNYWTRTETWEAIKSYLEINVDGLKDEVVRLLAGETVRVDISTFKNDMTSMKSRDDVLTLLAHLGYLTAESDCYGDPDFRMLRIPDKEIQSEFRRVIVNSDDYTQTARAVNASRSLLESLLSGDAQAVAQGVSQAHSEHSAILKYNDENSLSCVISLAFYSARDRYTVIRELPSGKGYADLAFIPRPGVSAPALLIELKHNESAETALSQIKNKHYPPGSGGISRQSHPGGDKL